MTNTGIIRKVDELGRVVLPIGLRSKLGISEKHPLEIWVERQGYNLEKAWT